MLNNLPLLEFATVIIVIIATFLLAWLVNRFFRRLIQRATVDMKNDPTTYKFLRHASVALIYIIGFGIAIYQIPQLRTLASSVLAGAGILAVAIGFASQQALSNIISGIFIILFRPFRVNDRLTVQNLSGIVEDITLRHTVIRDFENRRIIIPNTVISDEVIINSDFADGKICKWIDMSISYNSDLDLAKAIIREEVENHPLSLDPRSPEQIENGDPKIPVRVISLGESAVNIRAWAWAQNSPDAFVLQCDLLESIKKRFDKEGIEIPFPHRTIVYKDREALTTPKSFVE